MDEKRIEEVLRKDYSVETEAFREDLLARCLDIIAGEDGIEIEDDVLDMLAAAGDITNLIPEDPTTII